MFKIRKLIGILTLISHVSHIFEIFKILRVTKKSIKLSFHYISKFKLDCAHGKMLNHTHFKVININYLRWINFRED